MRLQKFRPPAVLVETVIVLAILLAAGVTLLLLVGADPVATAGALVQGAFGSPSNFGETLIRMIPVSLIALALIPSLRVGLFNIGAPGQMDIGALCGALASLHMANLPSVLVIPTAFVMAVIGGAVPSMICGVLKARLRVNEILATMVFNMLARLLLEYLLSGPLQGFQVNLPQSDILPSSAWLPLLMDGTRAHWGLALVVVLVAAMLLLNSTPLGYRLRLYGASPSLGQQAGADRVRMTVWTMAFAGAWAGVAGWVQVAGVDHRLYATVADTVGYTGLFAVLLGRSRPLGVLAASLVFAALLQGGDFLQIGAGISPELIDALIGLMLLVIASRSILKRGAEPS